MRAGFRSSFLLWLVLAFAAAACSSSQAPTSSGAALQAPEIIIPEDLVALIGTLTLTVYPATNEAGVMLSCDDTTGIVSGDVSSVSPLVPIVNDFTKSCGDGGGSFCTPPGDAGNFSIPYSKVPTIFSVIGYTTSNPSASSEVAVGCAQLSLDNVPTAHVTITLHHFLQPAMCSGNSIEPPQTCTGDDTTAVCSACNTVEELLSYGDPSSGSGTSTGSSGQMTNPFFLWGPGSGNTATDTAGAFMAFYTDASLTPSQPLQVTARFMDDTLSPPASSLFYKVADQSSIFLPSSSTVPQPQAANDEKEPSAAILGSNVYVTFASDAPVSGAPPTPNPFNIYLDSFQLSNSLAGQAPCLISTTQAGHVEAFPSVAASGSSLYVAWTDETGTVYGSLVTPSGSGCPTPEAQTMLGSGIPSGSNVGPKVASTGTGWAVVWPSGGNIEMQLINSAGTALALAETVGMGSNPAIGATTVASGATSGAFFAVAWTGPGGIQVQRYSVNTSGAATAIGATGTVSTTQGTVATPALAGSGLSGGFYAVSWIAGGTTVRARLLNATQGNLTDDSGYLFDPIEGQADDDFLVTLSTDAATTLANPTVAIGGLAGQYIAYGWENHASKCPHPGMFPGTPCYGILARRFPVPTD